MRVQGLACCSTPVAWCYWGGFSLLAWGILSLVGIGWYPLHASSAATVCLAVGIGCVGNWLRNRTLHCGITAPVFLIAGCAFLFAEMRWLVVNPSLIWSFVAIVTGLAFLLEWRYGARS